MWITNWWFTYHHPARPPLTSQRFQGFPPPWRPPKAASRHALPRPRRPRCHRRRPRRASRRSRRPQPNARRCAQKWCSRDDHHGYQWRSVRKTVGKMVVLKFGKTHGSDWCDGVEHRSNMVMPTGFSFMSCTLTGCYIDDGVGLGGGSCSTWTSAFDLENRQNATISMLWKLALMSVQSVNRNQVTLGVLAKKHGWNERSEIQTSEFHGFWSNMTPRCDKECHVIFLMSTLWFQVCQDVYEHIWIKRNS